MYYKLDDIYDIMDYDDMAILESMMLLYTLLVY